MQRRKYRIYLLEKLLGEEVYKVDPTFFLRLSNSNLVYDDKKKKNIERNLIFKDKASEKEFYKKYPTVWHLRNALVNGDKDALSDIRNVYLALHHIIKYRGNFLKEGDINLEVFDMFVFERVNELFKKYIEDKNEIDVDYDIILKRDFEEIIKILENKETNKKQKSKRRYLFSYW